MTAERRFLVHRERLLECKLRRLTRPQIFQKYRYVEVRPPLAWRLVGCPAGHRGLEVEEVLEMIAAAFGRLRQVDRVREALERLDLRVGDFADVHRRCFLQLHNWDARV